MIYDFNNISPKLTRIVIAPNSVLIGNVILKKDANIWFNATLRGDVEPITIGEGSIFKIKRFIQIQVAQQ